MATARRLTVAEAIKSLQVNKSDNSRDKNADTTAERQYSLLLKILICWIFDSDETRDQEIFENFNKAQSSIN